jgi:MYXO-CTERM domain-containing protein
MTTCAAQSADCGTIPDGCGGTLTCPTCATGTTCAANKCVANPPDLAMPPADLSMIPPPDLAAAPNDLAVGGADDLAANPPPDLAMGNGGKGGCGCRVGGESGPTPPLTSLAVALVLGLGLLRRRLRTGKDRSRPQLFL